MSHMWMYVCMHHVTHLDVCTYACHTVETKTWCHSWIMSPTWLYIYMICVTHMDVCTYARNTMWILNVPHMNHVTVMNIRIYTSYVAHVNARVYAGHTKGTATRRHTYESCHPYDCMSVCIISRIWMYVCMQVTRLGQDRYVTCMNHVKHMNIWTYEHMNIWTYEHMNLWTYEHMNIWIYEHMNIWMYASCRTCECTCVCMSHDGDPSSMSHIWIMYVTHMNHVCNTYESYSK